VHSSRSYRSFAALLAIVVFAGAVSGTSVVSADPAVADPYIDHLTEAAETPTLSWADCGDGFLCATAAVPLSYHHPNEEQIDLAVIKLPATDPGKRIAFWQGHDADRYTGPWNRRTSAPILVLNASNDPATPLEGAYAGASQMSQALVVVIEGAGHTSMYVASTCAERVKRDYLFSGILPAAGTGCSRDRSPFE
jgi:pimeloyl-ACP methyl ester carboxylesterase